MGHPGPLQSLLLEANRVVHQQSSYRTLRLWELDLHFFICETEPALLELSEIQQERPGRCDHSACHTLSPVHRGFLLRNQTKTRLALHCRLL